MATSLSACLVVGPAAGNAEAVTPRVSWTRASTSFTTAFGTYAYSYDQPVLSRAPAAVVAAVNAALNSFFTAAVATMTDHDGSLSGTELAACHNGGATPFLTGKRSSDSIAAIYKGRYLSVHVAWYGGGCDTPMGISAQKYLNIDLKTGNPVPITRFVDDRKGVFAVEIGAAMARSSLRDPDGRFGDIHGRLTIDSWRGFEGWAATTAGVWVFFTWEGNPEPYLVKWERILKPGSVKGHTTVSIAHYRCSDTAYRLRVTVRGGLVGIATPDQAVEYGVRGKSRSVIVHSTDGSQVILGKVTFRSKTSKRASSYISLSFC